MTTKTTRRHFLKNQLALALAASTFPTLLPATIFGKEGKVAPGNRVVVGCIGNGPQGRGDMANFLNLPMAQVVAVCDVNKNHLEIARKQVNDQYKNQDCATFHDFEALLARKDIDAVLIATTDQWHVPVSVAAARANKDIYLEKPMGLSVQEDQVLRKIMRQNKLIFQFGTQQRSSGQFRKACELVRNGRIGKLKQINVWCAASTPGGSTKEAPVPEGIDYERWLGPAPKTPHTEGKCVDSPPAQSYKTWWFNYDYALGFIAGWGVHPLDIALWGYPEMMKAPFDVEGKAIIPTVGACNTSVAWDVNFQFPDGVQMTYRGNRNGYDKVIPMNDLGDWQKKYGKIVDHGTAFEGTDGWVLVDRTTIITSPESLVEEKLKASDLRLIESSNHAKNFLESVLSRKPAICPIEEAVQADTLCHLSDIATRLERKLTWNPSRETFVKNDEANKRLKMRSLREPYRLK